MKVQELLWKYAEGECSPEEKEKLEKLLASKPALSNDLDNIIALHSALTNMDLEQPSMRFSKNVMDALPGIYPSISTESLLAPFWKSIFWGALAALTAVLILIGYPQQTETTHSFLTDLHLSDRISELVNLMPPVVGQYLLILLMAAAAISVLDSGLRKVMTKSVLVKH